MHAAVRVLLDGWVACADVAALGRCNARWRCVVHDAHPPDELRRRAERSCGSCGAFTEGRHCRRCLLPPLAATFWCGCPLTGGTLWDEFYGADAAGVPFRDARSNGDAAWCEAPPPRRLAGVVFACAALRAVERVYWATVCAGRRRRCQCWWLWVLPTRFTFHPLRGGVVPSVPLEAQLRRVARVTSS